jgi:ATP-dependent RNA helicase MSS116
MGIDPCTARAVTKMMTVLQEQTLCQGLRLFTVIFCFYFYFYFIFQEQTLRQALTGVDMLAKAKTGTGKTLAFLIPSIQQAAAAKEKGSKSIKVKKKRKIYICMSLSLIDFEPYTKTKTKKTKKQVLCISPTRELASQIYEEALVLCRFHSLTAQVSFGHVLGLFWSCIRSLLTPRPSLHR